MSVDTTLQFDEQYVTSFSKDRQEPDWLLRLRKESLELVQQLPLPKPDKTKIDKWNFTEFTHKTEAKSFKEVSELPAVVQGLIGQSDDQNLLVQQDGSQAFTQLSKELAEKGVIFTDIATAVREHSELVEKYFMSKAVAKDEHRLTALHVALLNGGTFIYVPKNVTLALPLQAIYCLEDAQVGLFNHILLVAEDNSEVTYVENYVSSSEQSSAVANIVAEVYAGAGAKVSYGAVDNFSKGVTTYVNRRGRVGRDGKVEWALGQMNDGNTVSENTTYLDGDGSSTDTKTVSIGTGNQKQNFVANVTHFGKHTDGIMLTHGVMKDSASSIFNGISKIEHGATKSNGVQTERVLMLSPKARGDANPILLIDEDDVTAGHAASVGRIDPTQMFYLMSRGLSRTEAERLVIHGFLAPVVSQLPIEAVKERLTEVIERKVK